MTNQLETGADLYDIDDVEFVNSEHGHTLAGTLTTPRGAASFPAVVLVSGSGPQDRDESVFGHKPFAVVADHLTRAGIAVLRFDDRGVGRSGGESATATSYDFASDVSCAVDYLSKNAHVSVIGLIGHSEGGLIAPIVAVARAEVAFIVLLAGPGLPGKDVLLGQEEAISRADGVPDEIIEQRLARSRTMYALVEDTPDPERFAELAGPIVRESFDQLTEAEREVAGLDTTAAVEAAAQATAEWFDSAWFRTFLHHDPADVLKLVRAPVLALVGANDLQVLAEPNTAAIRDALRAGGNLDATIQVLPGLNHFFQNASTGTPGGYETSGEVMASPTLDTVSRWILERS
jgi:pimeloyl-ACP methyl ester carboxylesterase